MDMLKKQDEPVNFVEDDRLIVLRRWAEGYQGADGVIGFQHKLADKKEEQERLFKGLRLFK